MYRIGNTNTFMEAPPTKSPYTMWEIITYENPEENLVDLLSSTKGYAYILHDKDNKADGTPKEAHYHILCTFTANITASALAKRLTCVSGNTLISTVHDKGKAYEYLTHKNNPDKAQYPDCAIVKSHDSYYVPPKLKADDKADETSQMIDDIINGKPLREMARKYGRDYMRNRRHYEEFCKDIILEEMGERQDLNAIAEQTYIDMRRLALENAKDQGLNDGIMEAFTAIGDSIGNLYDDANPMLQSFLDEHSLNACDILKLVSLMQRHALKKWGTP